MGMMLDKEVLCMYGSNISKKKYTVEYFAVLGPCLLNHGKSEINQTEASDHPKEVEVSGTKIVRTHI